MKSIFSVGYGILNREKKIREYLDEDYIVGVILADVHFEWVLKRTILFLGTSRTSDLRKLLEDAYRLKGDDKRSLHKIWRSEIESYYKNAALGTVVPNLTSIRGKVKNMRGYLAHGNGLTKKSEAIVAVNEYLSAADKLRAFATKHKKDLDKRLPARIKRPVTRR